MAFPAFPNKTLKVRAAVVLLHQEHVLLMRQNERSFWVLPGGTLEEGETVAQCAVRELMEEAHLAITLEKLLAVTDFIDETRQVVDITYLARLSHPPEVLPRFEAPFEENINAIEWVPLQQLHHWVLQPLALHQALVNAIQETQGLASFTAPLVL